MKCRIKKYVLSFLICAVLLSICIANSNNSIITAENKAVSVNGDKTRLVVLGGQTFGIKLFTDGIMIIKTENICVNDANYSPSKEAGLKVNDIITHINSVKVTSNEQLGEAVKNSSGNKLSLTIKRDNKTFSTEIMPIKDARGVYRIGIWVRDSSAGIGTVTFYDTENGYFAALGHGICDSDTDKLLPIRQGETVKAKITSVIKGEKGNPGGLNGYFVDENIGKIVCNSEYGMFGKLKNAASLSTEEKIEIAKPNEVKTGEAFIYSTTDEKGVEKYSIRIEAVAAYGLKSSTKNMIIRVTDKRLLDKTGGIVQGMSGSPIVQNGKLVGAVTHVFLNKPDTGYGIFAENMTEYFSEYSNKMSDTAA